MRRIDLGEIADDIVDIDRALRWGFGWERGPFETWGRPRRQSDRPRRWKPAGLTVPGWVKEQIAAQGEVDALLRQRAGQAAATRAMRGGFTVVPSDPRHFSLDAIRACGDR